MFWLLRCLMHTSCSSLRIQILLSHTVFRKRFVTELVQNNAMAVVVRVRRPVKAPQQLERLIGRHFISRIKTNGKKRNLARFCKVYNEAERNNAELSAQKRKRPGHETVYECQVCNVSLCIEPCFRLFHSCQEYALAYKRWKTANQPTEEE